MHLGQCRGASLSFGPCLGFSFVPFHLCRTCPVPQVPPPTQLLTLALFSPVCLSVWAPRSRQRPSCSYALCTVLLSLAVLLAVAVTSVVLFLNHIHVPGTAPPPVVSTGPAGVNGALVTVERADSSRLSILIDPRCPDLADGFARLEGAQASVLRALAEHRAQPPPDGTQERELLDTIADQLARLLARASELQAECAGLRKGHGTLGQGLSTLQSEQGRLIQVRPEPGPGAGRGCGHCPPGNPRLPKGRRPQEPGSSLAAAHAVSQWSWAVRGRELLPCPVILWDPRALWPTGLRHRLDPRALSSQLSSSGRWPWSLGWTLSP